MTPDRWQNILNTIQDSFNVYESDKYHLDEDGGVDVEYIIFKGPLGKMKLEYSAKPVVLGKKINYSKRIGSQTKVDYLYSRDKKNYKLRAFKWDEAQADWLEIDTKNFVS